MTCKSGITGKKSVKLDDFNHHSSKDADEERKIKNLIASYLKFR
ncbi:hypothetical protein [Methanobacterium petrolearium]|nr:hypothetical protein [Methanobacterium petrolearium]MBP1946958.1 hypothetical protein [Methanobacterium petrolearium]BDZ70899.1 hypothetical protein GCM10025861_14160 [Methanobacterium petrolearium]